MIPRKNREISAQTPPGPSVPHALIPRFPRVAFLEIPLTDSRHHNMMWSMRRALMILCTLAVALATAGCTFTATLDLKVHTPTLQVGVLPPVPE